ncbi:MAG TPA: Crp/Fnr family transcriptional regulator [Aquabacterium sp.]|nr:Crp/Fnr family transcriptional regulator [Aquabacterium sp.]
MRVLSVAVSMALGYNRLTQETVRHMNVDHNDSGLLAVDPWFSKLPQQLQQKFLAMAVHKSLPAGQTIVRQGQPHCGMFCLLQGAALVMNELDSCKEGVLAHLDPPAWFGEIGLFDGGSHTHTVQTDTPCTLMHIPRSSLLALLHAEPQAWHHLSLLLATKLRVSLFAMDEMLRLTPEQRVARRLLAKAAGLGTRQSYNAHIHIRQEQLAQTLGMARSTLNPILRKWSNAQWIQLTYGRITILDLNELKVLAGYETWPAMYQDILRAAPAHETAH